jgi:hypothetical protein
MDATQAADKLSDLISSKYLPAIESDYDIAFTTEEIATLLQSSFPSGVVTHDLVYGVMENLAFTLQIPPTEFSFKWLLKGKEITVL